MDYQDLKNWAQGAPEQATTGLGAASGYGPEQSMPKMSSVLPQFSARLRYLYEEREKIEHKIRILTSVLHAFED